MRWYMPLLLLLASGAVQSAESFDCRSEFYTLACFEPYGTMLLAEHRSRLDEIAKRIRDSRRSMEPVDHVTLIGHSAFFRASDPAEEMAQERAENAASYLRSALSKLNVTDVELRVGNVGTREPRTTNDTQEGRDLNRRVEIHLRSRKSIGAHVAGMRSYCSDVHRSHRIDRFRRGTCESEEVADGVCAERVALAGGEHLIGATCYPLEVICVVCKD